LDSEKVGIKLKIEKFKNLRKLENPCFTGGDPWFRLGRFRQTKCKPSHDGPNSAASSGKGSLTTNQEGRFLNFESF